MRIYVIKPNFVTPDALFFAKEKLKETFEDVVILENQSGPNYDPSLITKCDMLVIVLDESKIFGKGVFGEWVTAVARNMPIMLFVYDQLTRNISTYNRDKFSLMVNDQENYRQMGEAIVL
jgi:hypothetical protein